VQWENIISNLITIFMAKQQPSHIVYAVKRVSQTGEKGKGGFWTKIGAAWMHKEALN